MSTTEQQHWDKVYNTKTEDEVSWYQPYPKTSIDLIQSLNLPLDATIIDIGGGDSQLADALLAKGYTNIYVLDISTAAIDRAKHRLAEKAHLITWIISDITAFVPPVQFDCWHDRAAFHFLTGEESISKYVSIAEKAIKKTGHLILATFSLSGPRRCSGLDIRQYSEASLLTRFAGSFEVLNCFNEDHITPVKPVQNFIYCSFKRS